MAFLENGRIVELKVKKLEVTEGRTMIA